MTKLRMKIMLLESNTFYYNNQSINQSINHLALQPFVGSRLLTQVSPSFSALSCFLTIFNFQLF